MGQATIELKFRRSFRIDYLALGKIRTSKRIVVIRILWIQYSCSFQIYAPFVAVHFLEMSPAFATSLNSR